MLDTRVSLINAAWVSQFTCGEAHAKNVGISVGRSPVPVLCSEVFIFQQAGSLHQLIVQPEVIPKVLLFFTMFTDCTLRYFTTKKRAKGFLYFPDYIKGS